MRKKFREKKSSACHFLDKYNIVISQKLNTATQVLVQLIPDYLTHSESERCAKKINRELSLGRYETSH